MPTKNGSKKNLPITSRKRTLSRLMAVQIFYQFEFFNKNTAAEASESSVDDNSLNAIEKFTREKNAVTKIGLADLKNSLIDNYAINDEDDIKSYRDKIDVTLIDNLINGLNLDLANIDADIAPFLKGEWTLENISPIMLQILRLAALELKFSQDIPLKVLVNEYVDVAACFFAANKVTFANSVIENLAKNYRAEEFSTIKNK